jgi:hypothetical protein
MTCLALLVQVNRALQTLCVGYNRIDEAGAKALAEALEVRDEL